MIRAFLPPGRWKGEAPGTLSLSGEEAHHLASVLRVKPGEEVEVFDGLGREAKARVARVGKRDLLLEVLAESAAAEPEWAITLAAAVPGNVKFEEIINFGSQLGAARVIPLLTERTVGRITPERWASKKERLQRVAVEAAKQAQLSRITSIDPPTPWNALLTAFSQFDLVLMASVEGPHERLATILSGSRPRKLLLLIGPEGDFTPEETQAAVSQGARLFSLGPTVLRCETAAASALSVITFLLREGTP